MRLSHRHPFVFRFVLSAFAAFILLGAASLQAGKVDGLKVSDPSNAGFSAQRLARIDEVVERYIQEQQIPGAVTLVARHGKVIHFKAHGLRDAEAGTPMTEDTLFRVASMTKPITTVALMILWEEGRFQLDDPISKFLPQFADMKVAAPSSHDSGTGVREVLVPAKRPISVEHVLTHTAGFPNLYRGVERKEFMAAYLPDVEDKDATIDELVDVFSRLPLNFHPGEAWEYSRATCVAGKLVEVISGRPLDVFMRERIFEPLGMDDTFFAIPEDKVARFAVAYKPGEDGTIEVLDAANTESQFLQRPGGYFMGSGGLVSSTADYFRFQQMMLNGGQYDGVRLLGPKTVELMTANHTGDLPIWISGPGYGFGLGYGVKTDLGLSKTPSSVGTFRWGGYYCTTFWVDPAEEIVGILMTQLAPNNHVNVRADFETVVYAAVVE